MRLYITHNMKSDTIQKALETLDKVSENLIKAGAPGPGLVAKKVNVTRGGKTFVQTFYVKSGQAEPKQEHIQALVDTHHQSIAELKEKMSRIASKQAHEISEQDIDDLRRHAFDLSKHYDTAENMGVKFHEAHEGKLEEDGGDQKAKFMKIGGLSEEQYKTVMESLPMPAKREIVASDTPAGKLVRAGLLSYDGLRRQLDLPKTKSLSVSSKPTLTDNQIVDGVDKLVEQNGDPVASAKKFAEANGLDAKSVIALYNKRISIHKPLPESKEHEETAKKLGVNPKKLGKMIDADHNKETSEKQVTGFDNYVSQVYGNYNKGDEVTFEHKGEMKGGTVVRVNVYKRFANPYVLMTGSDGKKYEIVISKVNVYKNKP